MSGRRGVAAVVVAALSLAGCGFLGRPKYALALREPAARLRLVRSGAAVMCKGEVWYAASPEEGSPHVVIPAGARVTIKQLLYETGLGQNGSCAPAISFIPVEGEDYLLDAVVIGNRCFAEVAREGGPGRTGIAPVPTLGPGECK